MDPRERIASLMSQARPEWAELVAIRSVADPRQFPPEECGRAPRWVLDAFAGDGFSAGPHPRLRRERRSGRDAAMALTEALFLQRYAAIRS